MSVRLCVTSYQHLNLKHFFKFDKDIFAKSLEDFAATEVNEIFSGRQPNQDVKVCRRFG
jgi:hypothetical protein